MDIFNKEKMWLCQSHYIQKRGLIINKVDFDEISFLGEVGKYVPDGFCFSIARY